MNKNKIAILIVIIALCIAGVYFLFFNKNTVPPIITQPQAIEYKNTDYGFTFSLPDDWQGFRVATTTWTGYILPDNTTTEHGPEIFLINPKDTTNIGDMSPQHYERIPILVFTLAEWDLVSQEKMSVSAAPIGPSELGRNATYVFALPARYNYDYGTGWEEVQSIMSSNPLHTL